MPGIHVRPCGQEVCFRGIGNSCMNRHRHFNLWLHSDEELAPLVGGDIVERATLHEWPLSCVQQVTTSGGRRFIYKTQLGPTVESEFYASARSSLLVAGRTIYESSGYVCMLFDFIEASSIKDLNLSEEEAVRIGRAVVERIGEITGELPYFVDLRTQERWEALVGATLNGLRRLIDQGEFSLLGEAAVRDLERWAFSEPALSAIRTDPGYVHGDLAGDNLFVLADGYRVIDWQFPRLGPTDVDLATLVESLGFDPLQHVDEGVVQVMCFLRVHWLTQCAVRWIRDGAAGYDGQIAQLVSRML